MRWGLSRVIVELSSCLVSRSPVLLSDVLRCAVWAIGESSVLWRLSVGDRFSLINLEPRSPVSLGDVPQCAV